MSDLSQLKTLANMLRPLGEMISLVEKAESAEQAVRSAQVTLEKIERNRISSLKVAADAEAKLTSTLDKISSAEKASAEKCAKMVEEGEALLNEEKAKFSAEVEAKRREAAELVLAANNRVKTIDSTIQEKIKEVDRLEGKISKLKTDLRRLLASAEQ